ncbi:MAG: hypothetical protein GKR89_32855 [Candidatus Latescibacteria bacterium]|nr:hypothetical protein [Candidatus Latescibacterota bacterium]
MENQPKRFGKRLCRTVRTKDIGAIVGLLLWVGAAWAEAEVAVIVHKEVALDTLDRGELLDLYTGDDKFWDDKAPVVVLDLKPKGEVKEAFYRFLGKSPSRMKTIWMRKMLSGEGDPPAALETEQDIVDKVAATPGAIGFVGRAEVNEKVKTLLLIKWPAKKGR